MQDHVTMAKFRARLEQLTLKKSAERGSLITQKDLAEASEVPLSTLTRWYSKKFDRIDADTVLKLMNYFGCTLDELIEVVDSEGTPSQQKREIPPEYEN